MKTRIVIHATNTPSDLKVTIDDIQDLNSQTRYSDPLPYHYIVNIDGSILKGKKDKELCGHCGKFSRDSFSVAYAGGINTDTAGTDVACSVSPLPPCTDGACSVSHSNTLNANQDKTLRFLIATLQDRIEGLEVTGANALLHPDEPPEDNEPYFDVPSWLSEAGLK